MFKYSLQGAPQAYSLSLWSIFLIAQFVRENIPVEFAEFPYDILNIDG